MSYLTHDHPFTLKLVATGRSARSEELRPVRATEDDLRLMARVKEGDEPALEALLDRHWKPLVKYALWLLNDLDAAEDTVQETFVRVWRNRARWEPTGTVQAYLYRIVRNLALQENEKRAVRRRYVQVERPENPFENPAEALDRKRRHSSLQSAIAALPARRREILVLARFHDHSYGEIAEIMGISVQTVANQLSSALRDLRKAFSRMTA